MKKTLLFKLFTISFLLFGSIGWVNGQALLVEDFDFTIGSLLTANGWNNHSGTSGFIDVTTGLSFSGYLGSDIGGAANLNENGEDVNKLFSPQTSGTIYTAFVIKTEAVNSAGYFLHFGQSPINTSNFFTRVWVNATGDQVGLGTAASVAITPNTPTLLVIKYDWASKVSSLYIFNTFPTSEPAVANVTFTETIAMTNVGSVCLRQFNAAEKVIVDGIRVATNWRDAVAAYVADVTAPSFTATPNNADIDVAINTPIVLTFDEAIRNIDDSEITNANVAALLTLKETDASGAVVEFTATIDAAKKVITATPTADLKNSQVYYAAITPIEDAANNATTAASMTFTTIAASAATISDVAITETAPYYAGNTVTITWVSSNVTNVKIEAWIPGESKWDVLFASIPSDGSEAVTIPTDAAYSAVYKVRVTDVANALVTAESSAFTIIAVATDLLSLRAQPAGAIVKYTGIATITYSRSAAGRNQKYIQDATAAVLIDDQSGYISGTYVIGNGITNIVGKILFFNSTLLEFTPQSATGEPATGIEIVPEIRTLASIKPADQSKLVKIENFAFNTPTQYDVNGKFVHNKSYDIEGVDKAVMAYRTAFSESDYIGGYVPVGPISSIVLVGQFNEVMQFTARSWSDMTVPTVAAFDATSTFVLEGENVEFKDMSSNNPTSWEWTFEGGNPATSTFQNPVVTYSAKGTYNVTLKATNPSGGNNTITKTDYISIGVVGISTLQSDVKVYPNPTSDILYISNPAKDLLEITILSAIGKPVKSLQSKQGVASVDLSDFTKGIYVVKTLNLNSKKVQINKVVVR